MKTILIYTLMLLAFTSCHKSFLEEPTSKSLVIPQTYQDLNSLLQYTNDMNSSSFFYMVSDGDFTLTDTYLSSAGYLDRNIYLWKADIYETRSFHEAWRLPFLQILNANVVLEGIKNLRNLDASQQQLNTLKGNALFFRAMASTELLLNFTPPYVPAEASKQLGLPIRRSSNVSEIVQRSNLRETMGFIVEDLQEAIALLPERATVPSLPGKAAAYTLLSRTFLAMQEYEKSLNAAKKTLELQSELLNLNNISIRSPYTFDNPFSGIQNKEILFYQRGMQSIITRNKAYQLSKDFYDTFQTNDLRKNRFFDNNRNFIGSYSGTNIIFSGITNNEAFLNAAECAVRLDKLGDALNYLNTLCKMRYDETYSPYESVNKKEILIWILEERRKELITRTRWFDLRRLNLDPELAVTLTRTYKGETYTLPPNSSRYTFSIPQEEIDFSQITQHIRIDKD